MAKKPTKHVQLQPWEMLPCPVCSAEVGKRCWDLTRIKDFTTKTIGGRGGQKVMIPDNPITRAEPHVSRVLAAKRRNL